MVLSDRERDAARETIRRGLDEDLSFGPDVTTIATVPPARWPQRRWFPGKSA
ncbi:nicotinate-nucleotide pyrophosphorylase domain protein [Mycobacterium kansasii]|uniref:Nicotinate-nucleotide pyrophosphorylase domain protein n=1 Tax=Mycobacterium kansasii TaxID=1768 RepID=A0A1V3XF52_MYCKA|nr:nicotinate-nucleotide pyrophosphorylase domain protein [Mycobacterium kansasii]